MDMTKFFATAATCAVLAMPASAAVISANGGGGTFDLNSGDFFSGSDTMEAGDRLTYEFNVQEDLSIRSFSVAGTGFDAGEDLMEITFGYGFTDPDVDNSEYDSMYSNIQSFQGTANATSFLNGQSFMNGDRFFFSFTNNGEGTDANNDAVTGGVSFQTSPAPVPLPAGGVLILSALGAGAVFKRRKSA